MDANKPSEAPVAPPTPVAPPAVPVPATAPPKPAPAGQQIVDVVTAPARTAEETAEVEAASPTEQPPKTLVPAKPKTPASSDVKVAIVATVFIVVALAALAAMVYLKQK